LSTWRNTSPETYTVSNLITILRSMRIVNERLIDLIQNDDHFSSGPQVPQEESIFWKFVKLILVYLFGKKIFNQFEHEWQQNASGVVNLEEFLEKQKEVKEKMVKKASESILSCDDPKMFTSFYGTNQSETFRLYMKGYRCLMTGVLSSLLGTPFNTRELVETMISVFYTAVVADNNFGWSSFHNHEGVLDGFRYAKNDLCICYINLRVTAVLNKGLIDSSTTTVQYQLKIREYANVNSLWINIFEDQMKSSKENKEEENSALQAIEEHLNEVRINYQTDPEDVF